MTADRHRSRRTLILLIAGLLAAGGVGAYRLWFRDVGPGRPDFTLAASANGRGIGKMEQFQYAAAAAEFEEALRLAPDWLPARVNLGLSLFNQNTPEKVAAGRQVFADILAVDPNDRHALYCLGIIDANDGRMAEAHAHFQAVNKLDPDDPHTWYRLGMTHPAGVRSPEAAACFEQALKRNPYLNAARYALFLELQATDPKRAAALEAEWRALNAANWSAETDIRYGVMGKYADVIGRDAKIAGKPTVGPLPVFQPLAPTVLTLAPGTRWATAADLDPLRRAARARFGGTVVLFDFDGDGTPDVFLVAAVVRDGNVRDLLLRNDGNGTFTDVTAAAGLASPRPSLGAAAADFDNDGRPDLLVTGAGEQHLFRNTGKGAFEDVSAAAGLDKLKGTCLGSGWLDIDQDSDIDLVLCQYSDGIAADLDGPSAGGQLLLFENVGVAPPVVPNGPTGLSTAFRKGEQFAGFAASPAVGVVASDLDADRDVDLLLLADSADPVVIENDRLMRFKRSQPKWASVQPHKWNGGLVLDANHDERSDLFHGRSGGPPLFLLSTGERDFAPGVTNSPALLQAVATDIDSDGWCDVIGLGADGKPILLHNQGDGRLVHAPDAFGPVPTCAAVAVADLTGDALPDLLLWDDNGVRVLRNAGNGNASLLISPTGKRDKSVDMRTNADGIGTWLSAQAGTVWSGAERTTVSAGLGQSLLPTQLGIGKNSKADVLRLRWPDAVIQAELGVAAGAAVTIPQTQRKATSCPVLMTWDGERFAFVTDFLGGGALGESGPDGSVRPPRAEESVKIEPGQLAVKDGKYILKIAEPMDEVLYLDHLRLDVIDHPPTTQVYPDERFVFGPPEPTQKLLAFATRHAPKAATDHKGRDVLPQLRERDRRAVDGFARRTWLGYAEDHSLALDFGELPAGDNWYLVLASWTEYPYPESMLAAARAGVAIRPPVLETQVEGGKCVPVCDLGFPAGLPRVMTRELSKDFRGGRLRIATNMQVYWDQVFVGRGDDAGSVGTVTGLSVADARLAARGFMQEVYPDGRPPVAYDDAKTEPVATNAWKGHLTKLGDVTDLLREADDRFVLCGPGDEITVRFDAAKLPPLKPRWVRSFVLRTRGYCKDTSPTTETGREVGPLPFHAMPNYPDFGGVKPPVTDADEWHTRPAGRRH